MSIRAGITRTFTVSFPPKLAEQVEQLASAESRTTSELFREAFRSYRAERIRSVLAESNSEALPGHNGHREEDIERFVDEMRSEADGRRTAGKN